VGERITFASNGHTCSGYLAIPSGGSGPGVVVIQEWWGLVPHIEDVCDRFAAEGFTALAADLYHGETTTEPDEAGKRMMALNIDVAGQDMSGAVSWLLGSEHTSGSSVGAVGFCMGGGLAIHLAAIRPEVTAVVTYYGVIPGPWPQARPDFGRIRARVLGHFAEKDGFFNHDAVDPMEQRLRDAGVDVDFRWWPGVGHAFFNDTRPDVHDAETSRRTWELTVQFLHQNLD
jgi:carboxymethylenebutenolidase